MTVHVGVVHDCALTRRRVSAELAAEPGLSVTSASTPGTRSDGLPDVLLLDLLLAGRGRLAALRRDAPGQDVVLLARAESGDPGRAVDALLAGDGVLDVVPLPPGRDGDGLRAAVRDDLLPLVRAIRAAREPLVPVAPLPGPVGRVLRVDAVPVRALVICAGRTTVAAAADLLAQLPPDLPVPVTLVQQLPGGFETVHAQRVLARSAGPVRLAGGDADRALVEAAHEYGDGVLAVMLAGPGSAGVHGATAVRAAGGTVLAEAERPGRVWGVPGAVALAGQADRLVDPADLPAALTVQLAVALDADAEAGRHALHQPRTVRPASTGGTR